jgi:hypothetical protein
MDHQWVISGGQVLSTHDVVVAHWGLQIVSTDVRTIVPIIVDFLLLWEKMIR